MVQSCFIISDQSEDETLTASGSQEFQNDEDEDEQAQSAIFEVLLKETTL